MLKACRAITARMAFYRVIVMFQNKNPSLAPTKSADSYNSRGSESKNPLSRKMDYPWGRPGSINAAKVFRMLKSRSIRNTGIWVTMGGKAMVNNITSNSV